MTNSQIECHYMYLRAIDLPVCTQLAKADQAKLASDAHRDEDEGLNTSWTDMLTFSHQDWAV